MPYYAVGYGSTSGASYRNSTPEEIEQWKLENPDKEIPEGKNLVVPVCRFDGSYAKVAGPFKCAQKAWDAARELQKGASMMSDTPFVFKSGEMKLSTLVDKIDRDDFIIQEYYFGKHQIHKLRFIKSCYREDYCGDIQYIDMSDVFVRKHIHLPNSIMARRRMRSRYKNGIIDKSWIIR